MTRQLEPIDLVPREPSAWMAALGPILLAPLVWAWWLLNNWVHANMHRGAWTGGWTGNACPGQPETICNVIPWGALGTMFLIMLVTAPFIAHTFAWAAKAGNAWSEQP